MNSSLNQFPLTVSFDIIDLKHRDQKNATETTSCNGFLDENNQFISYFNLKSPGHDRILLEGDANISGDISMRVIEGNLGGKDIYLAEINPIPVEQLQKHLSTYQTTMWFPFDNLEVPCYIQVNQLKKNRDRYKLELIKFTIPWDKLPLTVTTLGKYINFYDSQLNRKRKRSDSETNNLGEAVAASMGI